MDAHDIVDDIYRPYNPLHISNYTRDHFDPASDLMVMCVNTETNSFTRFTQNKWIQDKLALVNTVTSKNLCTREAW